MDHSRVDRLMEQVERYYRGDFQVNGDWFRSWQMKQDFDRRWKNAFNGSNGRFTVDKMSCSEECVREGNTFLVPRGGVVYGPYFTFPPGSYTAYFRIDGDVSGCTVAVSSMEAGLIATGAADKLRRGEEIVLSFTLKKEVTDLELKTENRSGGQVIFKDVRVEDNLSEPDAGYDGGEPGNYQEWRDLQRISTAECRTAQESADCTLPQHTRFRAIKRFFRKLLNSFIVFQLNFNRKVADLLQNHNQQLQLLAGAVAERPDVSRKEQELADRVDALTREVERLRRQTEEQRTRLEDAELALHELAEAAGGAEENDRRTREIGELWSRVEETVKTLHDQARERGGAEDAQTEVPCE